MNGFIGGFSLGFSLILAIGSQNAFILRQGLKKEYVFIVCLICAVSDALLISLGVSGFAIIIAKTPWIEPVARYGGALFLFIYGARSFWSAYATNENLLPSKENKSSLTIIITICLAFTWLNPHVYLDTVILLGSVSTQYIGQKIEFTLGACLASFLFFFTLGYGARVLTPIFENPKSWKILDFIIGCIMWGIAFSLIKNQISSFLLN
ncbi:MAG TPA: amino acid transporter [Leucothrix sp.]|nr:amino acid transporter [Leucothrix sp.]